MQLQKSDLVLNVFGTIALTRLQCAGWSVHERLVPLTW